MNTLKDSRKFYLNITELKIALTIKGIAFEECISTLLGENTACPALYINGTTHRLKFRHANGSILNKNFRTLFNRILDATIMIGV